MSFKSKLTSYAITTVVDTNFAQLDDPMTQFCSRFELRWCFDTSFFAVGLWVQRLKINYYIRLTFAKVIINVKVGRLMNHSLALLVVVVFVVVTFVKSLAYYRITAFRYKNFSYKLAHKLLGRQLRLQ